MESLINLLEDHELLLTLFALNNPIHVLFESGVFLPIDDVVVNCFENPL